MKNSMRFMSLILVCVLCVSFFAVPASAYSTVRKGSSGSDVVTLQKMLNKVSNAGLATDGKFGSATQTAVKNFQKANGLAVDGIVGPATWSALQAKYNNPKPAASTLKIGSGKYSPGTLTQGNSYSISGLITSNYKITSVTVGVYNSSGKATAQVKTVKPNTTSYDIKKLDSYIKFGSLAKGSYTLKISATDASGKVKTKSSNFTVKAVSSTLKIGSGKYDPKELTQGSAYSISGLITSNYKITSVTVGVYNSSGKATAQVKTVKPNTTSYDIKKLDSYIKFGSLAKGSYKFKVIAADASGKTMELVNNSFSVKATTTNTDKVVSDLLNAVSRAVYANQILKDSRITLQKKHPESPLDQAVPYNNIVDTANGKAAKRTFNEEAGAPGGTVYLDTNILNILLDLADKYGKLTVTELAGGTHTKNSQHYKGKAVDLVWVGGTSVTAERGKEIYDYLKSKGYKLTPASGTVFEKDHYHIAVE